MNKSIRNRLLEFINVNLRGKKTQNNLSVIVNSLYTTNYPYPFPDDIYKYIIDNSNKTTRDKFFTKMYPRTIKHKYELYQELTGHNTNLFPKDTVTTYKPHLSIDDRMIELTTILKYLYKIDMTLWQDIFRLNKTNELPLFIKNVKKISKLIDLYRFPLIYQTIGEIQNMNQLQNSLKKALNAIFYPPSPTRFNTLKKRSPTRLNTPCKRRKIKNEN